MSEASKDGLSEAIVKVLDDCVANKMVLPFIICAISPNGSIYAARFKGPGPMETLAENFEGGGFRLPILLAVMDRTGKAVRMDITHEGMTYH
jgi:hypothetical protein